MRASPARRSVCGRAQIRKESSTGARIAAASPSFQFSTISITVPPMSRTTDDSPPRTALKANCCTSPASPSTRASSSPARCRAYHREGLPISASSSVCRKSASIRTDARMCRMLFRAPSPTAASPTMKEQRRPADQGLGIARHKAIIDHQLAQIGRDQTPPRRDKSERQEKRQLAAIRPQDRNQPRGR